MKLYHHPLSTYSQKVTIAFAEKHQSFDGEIVQLFDEEARKAYLGVYPLGKIPLLVIDGDHMIPESTTIIEYLDMTFDTGLRLIPEDKTRARQVRFHDRVHDLYLNEPVTTLLFQSWKPENERDDERITKAKFQLGVIYDFMNKQLGKTPFVDGDEFTLSDCAAAPALFYAQRTAPFDQHDNIVAYWKRLNERESCASVWQTAEPYLEAMLASHKAD